MVDEDTMNAVQGVTLPEEQIERVMNAWEQVFGNTTGTIGNTKPVSNTEPVSTKSTFV